MGSQYEDYRQGPGHHPGRAPEKAGLLPHTEVDFELDGDAVRIVKAKAPRGETRGERAVRLLRGSGTVRMTTDGIMALMRGDWRDDVEGSK